ncbi:hypothetical protein K438DRAFT_128078 [Mycena galopus ATCC 62051]|nr:hypothetical protein K438DRAFT_128078 [Mycena galopus ATCC 62051]
MLARLMQSSSMARNIASPSAFLFRDTVWLGGHHDAEQPLMSLQEYSRILDVSREDYPALFQCVFTFGLLEAVMEIKIPESVLLNEDRTMMVCARLPALLQAWRDRIRVLGNTEASRAWAERTAQTLTVANGFLELDVFHPQISTLLQRGASRSDLIDIFGTIGSIADALCSSRLVFPVQVRPNGLGVDWAFLEDMDGRRRQSMTNVGWCPFIIRSISGACALQYASTRLPSCGPVQYTHDTCSSAACVVNTVDTSTYRVRHAHDCSGCAYVKPHVAGTIALLSSRQVPVVRALHSTQDSDDITLTPTSFDSAPYVAISHVWSDGLGSTTETGLPSCQVRSIAHLVAKVLPDGHFWMDSLCVPERRDMRKRAITLMAETYRRAQVVLVIDSGIRTCSIHAPLEEKLLRVVTCGWMQRLWTLQEAMLAGKLVFEFLDGIVNVADLIPSGKGCLIRSIWGLLQSSSACDHTRLLQHI